MTVHQEFHEETGRQFWSVEEEWEQRIAAVHQLGKREAFVKVHNDPVMRIRTADVSDGHDERGTARFKERVLVQSPHVRPAADVRQEIEDRRRSLHELVEKTEEAGRPFNVKPIVYDAPPVLMRPCASTTRRRPAPPAGSPRPHPPSSPCRRGRSSGR